MIKTTFSIKDLENLSGIKAHTIRMWERRYDLFDPERSETNIRHYELQDLQKLLNVCYLKNEGLKISSIANLPNTEIEERVRDNAQLKGLPNQELQQLKLAMVNFNEVLFHEVYETALEQRGFTALFYEVFIPFLVELGNLWHSNTINIAHEHFISNLIKQKILLQTEKFGLNHRKKSDQVHVLFLPENEMHDLGLLFFNYKLRESGYKTVFLGASMSLDVLSFFQRNGQKPIFASFLTVSSSSKDLIHFLTQFNKKLNNAPLLLLGQRMDDLDLKALTSNQMAFESMNQAVEYLEAQR